MLSESDHIKVGRPFFRFEPTREMHSSSLSTPGRIHKIQINITATPDIVRPGHHRSTVITNSIYIYFYLYIRYILVDQERPCATVQFRLKLSWTDEKSILVPRNTGGKMIKTNKMKYKSNKDKKEREWNQQRQRHERQSDTCIIFSFLQHQIRSAHSKRLAYRRLMHKKNADRTVGEWTKCTPPYRYGHS